MWMDTLEDTCSTSNHGLFGHDRVKPSWSVWSPAVSYLFPIGLYECVDGVGNCQTFVAEVNVVNIRVVV